MSGNKSAAGLDSTGGQRGAPGKVLCLVGPTGAGKTEAALALAEAFRGSVVNFDSRQVYRVVPVTTAQPSPEEQARCPHLLYGFMPCSQAVSAGSFAEMAAKAVHAVLEQGRTPILVGGTGLYLQALLEGLAPIPDVPRDVRERVASQWDEQGGDVLHARLAEADPAYAARVHPNDRQRVTRALEVLEATGRTFSAWHALAEKPLDLPCLKMGIRMEKAALDRRLAARIHAMLEQGALEEVRRAVAETPDPSAPGLSGIGCAELTAHLRGELGFQEALDLWLSNTKAYAKRQMTWFKRDTSIHWFGPGKTREMVALASGWLNLRPISG
ncbi:tRNA (adenosine(37)-N6)-dimethylallyltransferase MiaA [Fundidesulfovibrio agrisoli]|uniref:tRNA (adenosine(37)-N6)-dimethylallyltransferase MiaA n=1 Tax=Fundidesulfovibrio agrisoli TaxID=2922717 RepID=UPI001FAB9D03|nr:tRNA (adenosine(37)-N6)-dimethylallyltransferase MiaA [Fundidesulfovibrio agrisoli]